MRGPAGRDPWRNGRTWPDSFRAARTGLWAAWVRGRNFRVQVAAGYAALVLASWVRPGGAGVAAIALTVGLVLSAEILNTAVEVLVDLVTSEYHPLARTAKDLAAGAVLLTAVTATVVAGWVFLPHLSGLAGVVAARWRAAPAETAGLALVLLLLVGAALRHKPPTGGPRPPVGPGSPWQGPPSGGRPPRA